MRKIFERRKLFSSSPVVSKEIRRPLFKSFSSSDELVEVNTEKMFSEITITITKKVDGLMPSLDPKSLLDKLSGCSSIGPKGIMIIRKSHGLLPMSSEEEPCCGGEDSWLEDSGILKDLHVLHGGETMDISDFLDFLEDNYPDAPKTILTDLLDSGVIENNNGKVEIK